jgi:RNA-directed DNA polymerase
MASEAMTVIRPDNPVELCLPQSPEKVTFARIYDLAALYEAVLKVYTKPLFYREKGLVSSHDGRTLYHFAVRGKLNTERLHQVLSDRSFHFRESVEIHFTRSRKRRTVYIFPWEERIVDELLYQTLNKFFHPLLSNQSYAFRDRTFGVDDCQHRIARFLRTSPRPLYAVKRDVSNYYPSVDQDVLLAMLEQWVKKDDYLFELLRERVKFWVHKGNGERVPGRGIPFGTAIACLLANIYLTPVDVEMAKISGLTYFRYADDMLALSQNPEAARQAAELFARMFTQLRLKSKASHDMDLKLAECILPADGFRAATKFQHLGLEFHTNGGVSLPRAKGRKIRNLFRRAFKRAQAKIEALQDPEERAKLLVGIARQVLEQGFRSIAILDYYLKHINDEEQLTLLDRWLAEEVLSRVFQNGHQKGYFRRIPFQRLREMGLPSLRHRHRLLRHGQLRSSFFTLWTNWLVEANLQAGLGRGVGGGGTVARSQDLISMSRSSGRSNTVR